MARLFYVDPGTAGMIVGRSVLPFIALCFSVVTAFLAKVFYNPIKRGIQKLWNYLKRKD